MLPTLILLKSICRFFRLLFLRLCLCVSCIESCARCVTSFAHYSALESLLVFVYLSRVCFQNRQIRKQSRENVLAFVSFCPRLFLFCSKREQTRESSCVRLYCSVVLVGCWWGVGGVLVGCWWGVGLTLV